MIVGKQIKQSIISHLLLTATLLTSGAIVNVMQLLLHICVKPFSRSLFHKCMYYVSWTWLAREYFIFSSSLFGRELEHLSPVTDNKNQKNELSQRDDKSEFI